MDSSTLNYIRKGMENLKCAGTHDKVYKEECLYSFDTPFSENGLFVNLKTYQGYGFDFWEKDYAKVKCPLYLHEVWRRLPKEEQANYVPTKLEIGTEGGFLADSDYITKKTHTIMIVLVDQAESKGYRTIELPLPNDTIPFFLQSICDSIINHDGMSLKLQVAANWNDAELVIESKYARNLIQLPNNKKISNIPTHWKCEVTGRTDNLWLNLSTGYIGGGRKFYDGSGGSGTALEHYEATGRLYPLAVKLGTITSQGADVYSYASDEDCMVKDPLLAEHLAYWGINIMMLEKSDKTTEEMNIEINRTHDWSKLTEGGDDVMVPVTGAGLKGLVNLGSTCYMNSLLQVLCNCIPEIQERYLATNTYIIDAWLQSSNASASAAEDFLIQFSKVAVGILTDAYTKSTDSPLNDEARNRITPLLFKHLVGLGHGEFSTGKQQDTAEYFGHLLSVIKKAERVHLPRLSQGISSSSSINIPDKSTCMLFDYLIEKKLTCSVTNQVKYICNAGCINNIMDLPIPLDEIAVNPINKKARLNSEGLSEANNTVTNAEEEEVLPEVSFQACMEAYFADSVLSCYNPSVQSDVAMNQSIRMKTFPRYLMVKLGRYYVNENWKQVKIRNAVNMPLQMDLSAYKSNASGPLPGEVLIPNEDVQPGGNAQSATPAQSTINENLIPELVSLGFSENGVRRALIATSTNDIEIAMNYILEHMEDAGFNDPVVAQPSTGAAAPSVSAESVMMIASMGFTDDQAKAALISTNQDVERAVDWLFSHTDELDALVQSILHPVVASASLSSTNSNSNVLDLVYDDSNNGNYELVAVISHMGKNTEHGHYVCHIKKVIDNETCWVLYNDEKVGISKNPPLKYGYMYLYKRI